MLAFNQVFFIFIFFLSRSLIGQFAVVIKWVSPKSSVSPFQFMVVGNGTSPDGKIKTSYDNQVNVTFLTIMKGEKD